MKSALQLGVNPKTKREENDFYATNPHAIEIALPMFQDIGVHKNIWECACGEGHISEILKNNGYNVKSSDLIDRGYGEIKDFLSVNEIQKDIDILTNPPFKLAEKFIRKSMEILEDGRKAIFFLKIQFAESQSRKKLFEEYPPKFIIANSERQLCSRNADFEKYKATTQFYCWFIFEKGYNGTTTFDWI